MQHNSRPRSIGINVLVRGDEVRRADDAQGQTRYAAVDIVGLLMDSHDPQRTWDELKTREPVLNQHVARVEFPGSAGEPQSVEGLSLDGVLRLIQSIPSHRAQRLKDWLARAGRQRLEEAQNPELLALRARKLYERRGYSRRWINKRLQGVSARHELTSEWFRRGARESDQFRALTNRLMQSAFGMDVESYRRYKNIAGAKPNLRDHMSDLELALTTLGETVAVALHQARDSRAFEQLDVDAQDAGQIVAQTRQQIERHSGRPIAQPAKRPATAFRSRKAELAKGT